jgi:hypothetical protein
MEDQTQQYSYIYYSKVIYKAYFAIYIT